MFVRALFLLLAFGSVTVPAFVPPVAVVVKQPFEERKGGPVEVVFRHQVTVPSGDTVEVEEVSAQIGGKFYVLFRLRGIADVAGMWERGTYAVGEGRFSSRSALWTRFFLQDSSDLFRDQLISERFLKRDQLLQFKAGFAPTGDPATWGSKANYLMHPDVYFGRAKGVPSIAVQGSSDRTVYFDRELFAPRRFEWREGSEVLAWNFESFRKGTNEAPMPQRASFQQGGREVVASDLIQRRYFKDRQSGEWLKVYAKASRSLDSRLDEALKVLLSYR